MPAERREWSPTWAPHVKGWYFDRETDEDGLPLEAEVGAECGHPGCGGRFKRLCTSGAMRSWIAKFALVHLHREPLSDVPRNNSG